MRGKYHLLFQVIGVGCLVFGLYVAAGFAFGLAWADISEDLADWWYDRKEANR